MNPYLKLMRLDKPVGILLTLWPALWALWIASHGHPSLKHIIVFVLGAIVARSAGCVINDYMDRDFDPHVERTKQRPLAANTASKTGAIILFVILGLAGLGLALLLNIDSFFVALIAAILATLYPLMKRFMALPQLILGIVFNAGVIMAFTATQPHIPSIAWILYITVILWTIAYDSMYAMSDRADDLKIGVKSSAILFGRLDRLIILILQIIVFALLLYIGFHLHFRGVYYVAWAISAFISTYQQILIHKRERQDCFKAFRMTQHIGWIMWLGIVWALLA